MRQTCSQEHSIIQWMILRHVSLYIVPLMRSLYSPLIQSFRNQFFSIAYLHNNYRQIPPYTALPFTVGSTDLYVCVQTFTLQILTSNHRGHGFASHLVWVKCLVIMPLILSVPMVQLKEKQRVKLRNHCLVALTNLCRAENYGVVLVQCSGDRTEGVDSQCEYQFFTVTRPARNHFLLLKKTTRFQ